MSHLSTGISRVGVRRRRFDSRTDSQSGPTGCVVLPFPAQGDQRMVVRAEGIEPTRAVKPCGFSCRLRLSPPGRGALKRSHPVCGLDYPFTLPRKIRGLGVARLVSTPSRRKFPAGLGSGLPFQVSPNLGSSASPVSQASTQVSLSPLRLPFRHARVAGYLQLSIIEQAGEIYTSVPVPGSSGEF